MISSDTIHTLQQNLAIQNALCSLMQQMYHLADSPVGYSEEETLKETIPHLLKVQAWLQKYAAELSTTKG